MVEMAVVFPLLVFLAVVLVQFAVYFHARSVVLTAVTEGAHVAATLDGSLSDGEARAESLIHAGLGQRVADRLRVSSEQVRDGDDLEAVRVIASGSFATFMPWLDPRFGVTRLSLPLNANAVVSKERFRGP
jgi:hypothetical protein